jgi:hypothetical protein
VGRHGDGGVFLESARDAAVRECVLAPGMLQATYFIPTFIVTLLLITHGLVFLILLRRDTVAARA